MTSPLLSGTTITHINISDNKIYNQVGQGSYLITQAISVSGSQQIASLTANNNIFNSPTLDHGILLAGAHIKKLTANGNRGTGRVLKMVTETLDSRGNRNVIGVRVGSDAIIRK